MRWERLPVRSGVDFSNFTQTIQPRKSQKMGKTFEFSRYAHRNRSTKYASEPVTTRAAAKSAISGDLFPGNVIQLICYRSATDSQIHRLRTFFGERDKSLDEHLAIGNAIFDSPR